MAGKGPPPLLAPRERVTPGPFGLIQEYFPNGCGTRPEICSGQIWVGPSRAFLPWSSSVSVRQEGRCGCLSASCGVGERFAYNLGSHLMAKHDVDPVLQQLVRAVNESGQATVPVTISVHGTVLTGNLIAQSRYFSDLVEGNPLMSALEPSSGLLGKEYTKEAEDESDHHLHVRAASIRGDGETAEGLWRISLEAVDGWALRAIAGKDVEDDRGPFARLLGTP